MSKHICDYINKPFQWNINDCATMVGTYYKHKYNLNIVDKFINLYSTPYGAYKAYIKAGKAENILKNDFVKVNKNYAREDDICIMKKNKMDIWGIVIHNRKVLFAGGATYSIKNINGEYYRYEHRH